MTYKFELTLEEAKEQLKLLKNDEKNLLKGSQRKVFTLQYICLEDIFTAMREQNMNYFVRACDEKERALNFSEDKDAAIEAGWYETNPKKVDQKKLLDWANKAYPNITDQLWDNQFEQEQLLNFIKGF